MQTNVSIFHLSEILLYSLKSETIDSLWIKELAQVRLQNGEGIMQRTSSGFHTFI